MAFILTISDIQIIFRPLAPTPTARVLFVVLNPYLCCRTNSVFRPHNMLFAVIVLSPPLISFQWPGLRVRTLSFINHCMAHYRLSMCILANAVLCACANYFNVVHVVNITCVVSRAPDLRITGSEHVGGSRSFGKAIASYDAVLAVSGIRIAGLAAGDRGQAGEVAEERTERRNAAGQDLRGVYSLGERTQRVDKDTAYTEIQLNVGPENDVVAISPGFEVLDIVHTDDLNDSDKEAEGEDANKDVLKDGIVSPGDEVD